MNRCFKATARHSAALLTVCVLGLSTLPSWAQSAPSAEPTVRPFPAAAVRAAMVVTQPPEIEIDGKPERLSPGARIRDANNMLVLSGTLVGKRYLVNLVREPVGLVHDVWILTEAEARLPRPAATPRPY
jgi:hypothetical protein